MAFTAYHNILGATAQDNELIAVNTLFKLRVSNIQMTNVHTAAATVDLYIFKDSTDTSAAETYYFLKDVSIPTKTSLVLDNSDLLRFDNNADGYSLYITVGSSDKVDVLISLS